MTFADHVHRVLGALRLDSWQSTLGGLGSRGDRGRASSLAFCDQPQLTDYELTAAYRNLWLVRRIVEARAEEALREGFGVELEDVPNFDRLNYSGYHSEGAFERALRMAELKGGAGIYLGVPGGGPEALLEPLPEDASAVNVAFFEVFDRFQLQAQSRYRDVDAANFDQPEIWCVTGHRRSGLRFHESRLITFKGAPLGGVLKGTSRDEEDWGDSVLQAVWADIQRYGVFWQSVAHLMQLSSVGVLKLKGLIAMLASQSQENAQARVDLLNESMSLTRLLLLDADADETYHREAVSFTDMPALLQEVQLATAGAFKMPVTKLFGRAPAGLNATGESDLRNWYDDVACWRMRQIEPALYRLLKITDGFAGEIEFEPLWQESAAEQATTRKVLIDGNERLWSMGVTSPEEIRKAMHEGKPVEELLSGAPPEPPDPPPTPDVEVKAEPDANAEPETIEG